MLLSDERLDIFRFQLEDEILTLRQVLSNKVREAGDLKRYVMQGGS